MTRRTAIVGVAALSVLVLLAVAFRGKPSPDPAPPPPRPVLGPVPPPPRPPPPSPAVAAELGERTRRDLVELRDLLQRELDPPALIPALVRLEEALATGDRGVRLLLEAAVLDPAAEPRRRALLALILGRYPGADPDPVLLKALQAADGGPAQALLLALGTRPGPHPPDLAATGRFWVEALHAPLFGSEWFPGYVERVRSLPSTPKSFKTWYERIGPIDRPETVLPALDAATRTRDAAGRSDLLFLIQAPAAPTDGLLERVQRLYHDDADEQVRARALAVLARCDDPAALRFLEEQAVVAPETAVKTAAAEALLRWGVPDIADRLGRLAAAMPDPGSRAGILELAYRSDTPAMLALLQSVASTDVDGRPRRAALVAVGSTDPRKHEALKGALLQTGLRDGDVEVRTAALDSVRRLRYSALRDRVKALAEGDPDPGVVRAAQRALAALP